MKTYRKRIIITIVVTLLPILAGVILWNRLPDQIATHWGMDGAANGWSSKAFAVFGTPCILTVIQVIMLFIVLNDPKKKNIHRKPMGIVFWMVPVISLVVSGVVYVTALGFEVNILAVVYVLVGVLFIFLGNYMPKLQQNYTVGIRLPWTLNNPENWNRTHRLGGKIFTVGGIAMLIIALLANLLGDNVTLALMIADFAVCVIIPVAYSFIQFRKML